jgi:hypothetical protein
MSTIKNMYAFHKKKLKFRFYLFFPGILTGHECVLDKNFRNEIKADIENTIAYDQNMIIRPFSVKRWYRYQTAKPTCCRRALAVTLSICCIRQKSTTSLHSTSDSMPCKTNNQISQQQKKLDDLKSINRKLCS